MRQFVLLASLGCAVARSAPAQQPFVTDDAEVTPLHEFHFEYANTSVALPRSASPDRQQNTSNVVVQFGLLPGLEANVDFPLIYIARDRSSPLGSVFGFGDVDLGLKWKLVSEEAGQPHPALTLSAFAEFPTGSESKQLGSGLTDYSFNSVVQKTLGGTVALHVNAGIQFSGNTLTGAVGIRVPGRIYSGGISASQDVSASLRVGIDLNGAETHAGSLRDRLLQLTVGGNLQIGSGRSLDFAVLTGWFSAPRVGLLVGFSMTP